MRSQEGFCPLASWIGRMESEIRGKNLTISESSRNYITRKLDRLSRRLDNVDEARVELKIESTSSEQERMVAQMTLNCNGTILRGEECSHTITAAMDAVADVLDSRVRRLKGRLYKGEQTKKSGRGPSIRDPEAPADAQEEEEDSYEARGPWSVAGEAVSHEAVARG